MIRCLIVAMLVALSACTGAVKPLVVDGTPFQPHVAPLIPADPGTLPPVSTLGIRRVGVVVQEDDRLTIHHARVSFVLAFERHPQPGCLPSERLASAFVSRIDALPDHQAIDVSALVAKHGDLLESNFWYGTRELTPEASELQHRLRTQHDLDALLVIQEDPTGRGEPGIYLRANGVAVGNRKASPVEMPGGKGITTMRRARTYAFALFHAQLIDLRTGKQTPRGAYYQGAVWQMEGLDWSVPWQSMPEEVIEDLCERLVTLTDNNVAQTLWRLRIDSAKEMPTPR